MNCVRADFDDFTVFVSVFRPGKSFYHHGHEDCLSYVLYLRGREILIDPGRPDYGAEGNFFVGSAAHNGLSDVARPVRPQTRFFFSSRLNREPAHLKWDVDREQAVFKATNSLTGSSRSLVIERQRHGCLRFREALASAPLRPVFTHVFADLDATSDGPDRIRAGGATLTYLDLPEAVTLRQAERGKDYGEIESCQRLSMKLPDYWRPKLFWEVDDTGQ
ncbi:heparinase II/III domain-containing protein [Radicibacter daui]|uniref:heparinase II/III domain-containing protein n=1 Tax=Radicibacter daui TaxID=3064829 RepID=UPI004046AC35